MLGVDPPAATSRPPGCWPGTGAGPGAGCPRRSTYMPGERVGDFAVTGRRRRAGVPGGPARLHADRVPRARAARRARPACPEFIARAGRRPAAATASSPSSSAGRRGPASCATQLAPVARVLTEDEEGGPARPARSASARCPAFALLSGDTMVAQLRDRRAHPGRRTGMTGTGRTRRYADPLRRWSPPGALRWRLAWASGARTAAAPRRPGRRGQRRAGDGGVADQGRARPPDRRGRAPVLLPVLLLAATGVAAALLPQAVQFAEAELKRAIDLTARAASTRRSADPGSAALRGPAVPRPSLTRRRHRAVRPVGGGRRRARRRPGHAACSAGSSARSPCSTRGCCVPVDVDRRPRAERADPAEPATGPACSGGSGTPPAASSSTRSC